MKKNLLIVIITVFLLGHFAPTIGALQEHNNTSNTENQSQTEPSTPTNNSALYLTDNFAVHYFSELKTHFPKNDMGSCAYVSMSMLLSFYDTYWDDTILDENFDSVVQMSSNQYDWGIWESPGVHKEINHGGQTSNQDYYQACQAQANSYFQCHLICLNGGGSWNLEYVNGNLQFVYGFGLNHNAAVGFLQEHWEDYIPNKMQIIYVTNNVRNSAIQYIKQGIPVIFSVCTNDPLAQKEYHSVVGYDYDEKNDRIFVHAGWSANDTHTTITDIGYTYYQDFYALIPRESYSHICSNNYNYIDSSGDMFLHCPCESPLHPAYEPPIHFHDEYLDVTSEWHTFNCVTCDTSGIEEPHERTYYDANPGATSATTHRVYCHCGYYSVEPHLIQSNPGSSMLPCLRCGEMASGGTMLMSIPDPSELVTQGINAGAHTMADGTVLQILTESGSYVLPNGVIVLSDMDAALLAAGRLDLDALLRAVPPPPQNDAAA